MLKLDRLLADKPVFIGKKHEMKRLQKIRKSLVWRTSFFIFSVPNKFTDKHSRL